MGMSKKAVVATLFVACLMVASLGAFTASSSEGSETIKYVDVNEPLSFIEYAGYGEKSAKIINDAVGSEVCKFNTANGGELEFTASCSLRCANTEYNYFMLFGTGGSIRVDEGVTVNLIGGATYDGNRDTFGLIVALGTFTICGEGNLNIALKDPKVSDAAAILVWTGHELKPILSIHSVTLKIASNNHSAIAFYNAKSGSGTFPSMNISKAHVVLETQFSAVWSGAGACLAINSSDSTFKMSGTKTVFHGYSVALNADKKLYASMNYRATDLKEFEADKVLKYQFVSTEKNETSGLVIPLAIVFGVICIALFVFVFIYVQKPKWEQDKINAEKAKKKAELAAKRAEEKKIADAKRAEMEKKKAADRKIAEERKAKERAELEKKKAADAKAKEEARKVAEAKKAADRKAAEERKAADAKAKEEARKAAEAKKAADRKAAEERKAKELEARKAAEAKKAADKKAAAEAKAKEAEARKAIKAREAQEAKQREEARKAEKAKKAAQKKK